MTGKKNNQKKGILLVLSTSVISGFAIFANGLFVTKVDPSTFTFLKNTLVAFAILGLIFAMGKFSKKQTRHHLKSIKKTQWLQLITIGLLGGSIPFILFFEGLAMTSGTAGAFIHKTMFIFVAVIATIFLREKLNKWIFPLALVILAGNFFLLKTDFSTLQIGHYLIFAATIFWAIENTLSKHVLKKLNGSTVAFGRMFFGSIFILIYLGLSGKLGIIGTLNSEQWLLTVVAAAFLLGYVLTWYNGLKHIPVTLATSILLLGAPITTLLKFVFMDKGMSVMQVFGILLLVLGITGWIFLERNSNKRRDLAPIEVVKLN